MELKEQIFELDKKIKEFETAKLKLELELNKVVVKNILIGNKEYYNLKQIETITGINITRLKARIKKGILKANVVDNLYLVSNKDFNNFKQNYING